MIEFGQTMPSAEGPHPWPGAKAVAGAAAQQNFELAARLITSRRHFGPRWLEGPGPTADQLQELLVLAAAAPDHGQLLPWRLVLIPIDSRHLLGQAFALALLDRDPGATADQLDAAREKAHRAPTLLIAVARPVPDRPEVPLFDQLVSLGAAVQNVQLGAVAMGFQVGLSSGRAMNSRHVRSLLGCAEGEQPVCCISIGRSTKSKPSLRVRPEPSAFFEVLRS